MSKYGYVGAEATQSTAKNSGVFQVSDINELKSENDWTLQEYAVQYLVIGGGGSGGGAEWVSGGGGGGAGGYRNSYASEASGANSSTETPLTIQPNTDYTITVGGGGAAKKNQAVGAQGSSSVFASITSLGGAGGAGAHGGSATSGGSGGGGTTATSRSSGTANQGSAGGHGLHGPNTCPNHYLAGGAGGGAGGGGNTPSCSGGNITGGNGLESSITGTAVKRAGGGYGAGNDNTFNYPFDSVWGGGGTTNGQGGTGSARSGVANKGGGGGAATSNLNAYSGAGGKGVVIVRVPFDWNCNNSSGLTKTETLDYANNEKVIEFTNGTDTVQFGA